MYAERSGQCTTPVKAEVRPAPEPDPADDADPDIIPNLYGA